MDNTSVAFDINRQKVRLSLGPVSFPLVWLTRFSTTPSFVPLPCRWSPRRRSLEKVIPALLRLNLGRNFDTFATMGRGFTTNHVRFGHAAAHISKRASSCELAIRTSTNEIPYLNHLQLAPMVVSTLTLPTARPSVPVVL